MFKPFLGRIVVEAIDVDTDEYLKKEYGIGSDSCLVLPEEVLKGRVPVTRGKIVVKGDTTFGDRFEKWYGKDCADEGKSLQVGDIVQFVENQNIKLGKSNLYIISDEHILGYERVTSKPQDLKEIEDAKSI